MQIPRSVISMWLAASWAAVAVSQPAAAGDFTMSQVLDYPMDSELAAAEHADVIAWVRTIDGVRNIWFARGPEFKPVPITHYQEDDGQEINAAQWTSDAAFIVYVRGDGATSENHPVPNPAGFPKGAQQRLWVISAANGETRLLGEGNSPAVSPDGKQHPEGD